MGIERAHLIKKLGRKALCTSSIQSVIKSVIKPIFPVHRIERKAVKGAAKQIYLAPLQLLTSRQYTITIEKGQIRCVVI